MLTADPAATTPRPRIGNKPGKSGAVGLTPTASAAAFTPTGSSIKSLGGAIRPGCCSYASRSSSWRLSPSGLAALVRHANEVLSRDQLLDLSRHREAGPFDRTIDVQVGRLRRKLEDDPKNPAMIKTVRGGGYVFTPTVEAE